MRGVWEVLSAVVVALTLLGIIMYLAWQSSKFLLWLLVWIQSGIILVVSLLQSVCLVYLVVPTVLDTLVLRMLVVSLIICGDSSWSGLPYWLASLLWRPRMLSLRARTSLLLQCREWVEIHASYPFLKNITRMHLIFLWLSACFINLLMGSRWRVIQYWSGSHSH